ncbi:hypothetical protein N9P10_04115 [Rhodobacteraceae bacterium]|nr:hypothetical protein [Paracoccaceae bacterium]
MADAVNSISAGPLSLTLGETYTDNVASTSDVDYFKISSSDISVPSTATVTFTGLSSTTNNNEFVVTIRDASDVVLNTLTTGVSNTFSAPVSSTQPYYIRVEDGSTFDNSNYSLKVDVAATSESELASSAVDNGSVASSNHLIDNVSFVGKLQSATDSDWYAFTTGNVEGSTVTVSVAPTASDATFYNVKITDENGTTLTKTGGDSLSTTAGTSAASLTFNVAASSSTTAGTYFLNVSASDSSTFAASSEFGNNYAITLAGTTDYNATPVTTIGTVSSGTYGTITENDNVYANVSKGSTTALSSIVSVSDADTDTINSTIGTYYIGLQDTTSASITTSGTITYTDDDTSATTIITSQASSSGGGFFNALSAAEFVTASYVAGSSGADDQKIYAFAVDTSGSSGSALNLTYPFDTSGIVKYRYITSDAEVTISSPSLDPLYEGVSSTDQVLTATLVGMPSGTNDVTLVIDAPVDLNLSGSAVTQVSAEDNTYRLTLDADTASAEFTVTAPVVADSDGVTETATLTYATVSSDSNFNGLTVASTNFTVSENIATFTVSDVIYSSGTNVAEGSSSKTATYTITAADIGSSETLTLNLASSGLTFNSATSFDLTVSNTTATIIVVAEDDSTVEAGSASDGVHSHAITHAIYEGSSVASNYVGTIADKSVAVADNDGSSGTTISIVDSNGSISSAIPSDVILNLIDSSSNSTSFTSSSGDITLSTDLTISHVTVTASSSHEYSSGIALDDVMSSLRAYVGMTTLTGQSFHAADIDNNGSLELSDVMSSLRAYVGMTTINTFDLIDSSGNIVTDMGSSTDSTLFLVENGDVSLDGEFVVIT